MDMSRFARPPPDAADDPQAYQMAMDTVHPVDTTPPAMQEPLELGPQAGTKPPDDALKAAILEQAEKTNQFSEQFQSQTAQQNEQSQQQALQLLKGNIR